MEKNICTHCNKELKVGMVWAHGSYWAPYDSKLGESLDQSAPLVFNYKRFPEACQVIALRCPDCKTLTFKAYNQEETKKLAEEKGLDV